LKGPATSVSKRESPYCRKKALQEKLPRGGKGETAANQKRLVPAARSGLLGEKRKGKPPYPEKEKPAKDGLPKRGSSSRNVPYRFRRIDKGKGQTAEIEGDTVSTIPKRTKV